VVEGQLAHTGDALAFVDEVARYPVLRRELPIRQLQQTCVTARLALLQTPEPASIAFMAPEMPWAAAVFRWVEVTSGAC
jgi:hypothetical protein